MRKEVTFVYPELKQHIEDLLAGYKNNYIGRFAILDSFKEKHPNYPAKDCTLKHQITVYLKLQGINRVNSKTSQYATYKVH